MDGGKADLIIQWLFIGCTKKVAACQKTVSGSPLKMGIKTIIEILG
jgi:hypothetical protein